MDLIIGQIVKARIEQVGISKTEVARRLHMSPANVHKIFKRQTLDIALVQKLSEVLNYDFMAHYKHMSGLGGSIPAQGSGPNVAYTFSLRKKIAQVVEVSRELSVEEGDKSVSQFLSELDFIQEAVKDIRASIS